MENETKIDNANASPVNINNMSATIAKMIESDAQYKKNDETYHNYKKAEINNLLKLKETINEYCEISDKWNMTLTFVVGLLLGGLIVFSVLV